MKETTLGTQSALFDSLDPEVEPSVETRYVVDSPPADLLDGHPVSEAKSRVQMFANGSPPPTHSSEV